MHVKATTLWFVSARSAFLVMTLVAACSPQPLLRGLANSDDAASERTAMDAGVENATGAGGAGLTNVTPNVTDEGVDGSVLGATGANDGNGGTGGANQAGVGGANAMTGATGSTGGSTPAAGAGGTPGTAGTTGSTGGANAMGGAAAGGTAGAPALALLSGATPDCANPPAAADAFSTFVSATDPTAGTLDVLTLGTRPGGSWRVTTDGTTGAVTMTPVALAPAICENTWALEFKGSGFTLWGALTQGLFGGGNSAIDVSHYHGLRFKLRASAPLAVRLKVPDRATYRPAGMCTVCDDHFGADLSVGTTWTEFKILFANLTQTGTGVPAPAAFDPTTMYGFEILSHQDVAFDLWIAGVSFMP